VFSKRSSENRVIARSGQTVVIGGLLEDRETGNVSKVPLLGDIPLLGALFRSSGTDTTKTELLIFLTPTVAATDKELLAISEEKKEESELIRETYGLDEFESQGISMLAE
jgi:general secretion pathway protein D